MKRLPPAACWIAVLAVLSACSTEENLPSPNRAVGPNVVFLAATEYAFDAPEATLPMIKQVRVR